MKLSRTTKIKARKSEYPDTVIDNEKAHLMALAEKPYRERASLAKKAATMLLEVAQAPTDQDASRIYQGIGSILDIETPHEPSKTYMMSDRARKDNEELMERQRAASLAVSTVQATTHDKNVGRLSTQEIATDAIADLREQNNTWVEAAIKAGDAMASNYEDVNKTLEGFK